MFKHLLVPLDGSQLAESALPAAVFFAQRMGAAVTLIHVIERHAPKEVHSDRHLTEAEEAKEYLAQVASRAFPEDVSVETHVHTAEVSNVARSIVEHQAELEPDLVVMCTHGKGGVRDALFGNIAQQIIAQGKTPVLLIHPENKEPEGFTCSRMLVPLDGDQAHERGLQLAAELADLCQSVLHLLTVVPTFGTLKGDQAAASRMMPGATSAALDLAEEGSQEYLRKQIIQLKDEGIQASGEVKRGDPSEKIVEAAEEIQADLLVLGTHGKTGTDAFWSGSVTPKVANKVKVPILFAPITAPR